MITKFDKALVAVIGMALLVLNAAAGAALPAGWQGPVNLAIAVLTPISVYLVPNKAA